MDMRLKGLPCIPRQASNAKLCWLLYTHVAGYYTWYLFIPCGSGYVMRRGERDEEAI